VSLDRTLQRVWYERSPLPLFLALIPLSLLFAALSGLRRAAFRLGLLQSVRVAKPVIVVGNITVGGTGKTPLVIWIAEFLQQRQFRVGVITRGYGGTAASWPQDVTRHTSAAAVGDEAVLIAHRTGAIVVAGPDRVEAAHRAITLGADVVVSDDGLQHYRLDRAGEIVVIDAARGIGNGWLLPAGPLREREERLQRADLVVGTARGGQPMSGSHIVVARHALAQAQCMVSGERRDLSTFAGATVHAVAGIGNPEAFFAMLRQHGLVVDARALPDHAVIGRSEIDFPGSAPVLMTEKDAVKCQAFATQRHWAVRLDLHFSDDDARQISALLLRLANAAHTASNADG
jgi:tetraacyldisaccharide 4'-kinase